MAATYCSVSEVREFTKVQSVEYSDDVITLMIENAQAMIDDITNSTFGGTKTVTEYYEVEDDKNYFFTNHYPIVSISSLEVDDDNDGDFTALTEGDDFEWWDYGKIQLKEDASISSFPSYIKSIKITYSYGNSSVPEIIRYLTLLLVQQQMQDSPALSRKIDELINRLSIINIYM